MSTRSATHSFPELLEEVSGWLAGGGILTVALFPLAVPIIALTAVAALPLLLVPLAVGLVVAVVAAPILLIRSLARRVIPALGRGRATRSGRPSFRHRASSPQPRET